jgi:AraC-like DNA-binding protein
MTWTRRIRLTTHDAVFAGQEALLMRELVEARRWPAGWTLKGADCGLVSLWDQFQLLQRIETGDAEAVAGIFGLVDFGTAGAAVLASKDLHSAIDAMNSYAPLLNLRHTVKLVARDDDFVMTFNLQAQDQHGIRDGLLSVDIAKMRRFLKDLGAMGQRDLVPRSARSILSGVGRSDEHIRIPKSLVRIQPIASPAEANARHKECRKMMRELRGRTLCGRVRRMLMQCPDACPSMAELATKIGMSGRSFRRHLANQHTTFQEILDEVRFELAVRYLQDRRLTTELIAQKLGYSESANFRAAFRRWTGSSPRRFDIRAAQVQARPRRRSLVDESERVQCA